MIVLYFFIGLLLAALGGAFPGASNIAVISATVKSKPSHGLQIAYGAGIGEMLLAFMALSYSMMVSHFFEMNMWIKSTFAIVFLLVGVLFIFKHKLPKKQQAKGKIEGSSVRFLKGFILGAVNPPVLLFWLVAIALVHNNIMELSAMLATPILLLFFSGVFLGKLLILFVYGQTGKRLVNSKNQQSGASKMNRAIGLALIGIALIQGVRLWAV